MVSEIGFDERREHRLVHCGWFQCERGILEWALYVPTSGWFWFIGLVGVASRNYSPPWTLGPSSLSYQRLLIEKVRDSDIDKGTDLNLAGCPADQWRRTFSFVFRVFLSDFIEPLAFLWLWSSRWAVFLHHQPCSEDVTGPNVLESSAEPPSPRNVSRTGYDERSRLWLSSEHHRCPFPDLNSQCYKPVYNDANNANLKSGSIIILVHVTTTKNVDNRHWVKVHLRGFISRFFPSGIRTLCSFLSIIWYRGFLGHGAFEMEVLSASTSPCKIGAPVRLRYTSCTLNHYHVIKIVTLAPVGRAIIPNNYLLWLHST